VAKPLVGVKLFGVFARGGGLLFERLLEERLLLLEVSGCWRRLLEAAYFLSGCGCWRRPTF
jgi:hypothetical protein